MMTHGFESVCGVMTKAVSLIDDLENALASGDESHREEMLSRMTDLFVSGAGRYSADQVGVFDEVIGKVLQ